MARCDRVQGPSGGSISGKAEVERSVGGPVRTNKGGVAQVGKQSTAGEVGPAPHNAAHEPQLGVASPHPNKHLPGSGNHDHGRGEQARATCICSIRLSLRAA
jgi:hypothetical protein